MRFEVGAIDVVHVVCRDHPDAVLAGPPEQNGIDLLLLGQPVILNLDVIVLAEQLQIPLEKFAGGLFAFVQDRLRNLALQAAGGGDQPSWYCVSSSWSMRGL